LEELSLSEDLFEVKSELEKFFVFTWLAKDLDTSRHDVSGVTSLGGHGESWNTEIVELFAEFDRRL